MLHLTFAPELASSIDPSRQHLPRCLLVKTPQKDSRMYSIDNAHISRAHSLTTFQMYLKPEFAALLQNNDAPSESTILEVTESLKVALNKLQEIQAEIQRPGKLMETVKMKHQSIQKIIDDHYSILSPARRLSPDVLHEIFFHCLPTHHSSVMKSLEPPLLLTQICSSWRVIALSSPRMWSKIHIPLPGDPRFSELTHEIIINETRLNDRRRGFASVMRSRCDGVRDWLSRSGTCPLSLSVIYSGDHLEDSEDDEHVQEMFDILLSFADRWSDVNLSMPEDIYDKLQCDINPTTFSSLKSLKIALRRKPHWDDTELVAIRLLAAPGLRRINISAMQTLFLAENLIQPIWNHITHITFTSSTTDIYLLVLLRQCPNLVFGNFFVISWPETVADHGEVSLPRLETLAINDSGAHETMTIIFNAIKAPALKRLLYQQLDQPFLGHDSTVTPVIPLLENSTLISDLSLDGGLSSQDIQECLQRGAQVTHVVFGLPPLTNTSGDYFPPAFMNPDAVHPDRFDLKILSIDSVATTLLPRLESLEAYHLSSLTDEDLLDVITSRINAFTRGETAALKVVKIHFRRYRQKDISNEVSRLAKEAGIAVKLDLHYRLSAPLRFIRHEGTWPQFTTSAFPKFK